MESKMLERWSTRGGKYTIELWRHASGMFDIYEFKHASRQGASINYPESIARDKFKDLIYWAAKIDSINYKQVYPAVQP
jgi:hypothetical protein